MAKRSTDSRADQAATDSSPADARPFEEHLAELEELVEALERGELGLEEALSTYERGVGQLRRCHELLEAAEARVEELLERADGTLATRPLTRDDKPPRSD